MTRRTAPPSGAPAPQWAALGDRRIALEPLAEAVADRYFAEYPDDLERYGDTVARAWEIHDTLYCLQWAVLDVSGSADLAREIAWLADVLGARGFPLERLARNLDFAADVIDQQLGEPGAPVSAGLRTASSAVRG